jgi:tetratricopeptide (TPR) repeat protein
LPARVRPAIFPPPFGPDGTIDLRNLLRAAVLFGLASLTLPPPAEAVVGDPVLDTLDLVRSNPLVRRAQRALTDLGLYKGPISGVKDTLTETAIRTYQKSNGIKEDGVATEELVAKIETGSKVSALLSHLEQVRRDGVAAAREALLSRPETRDLVGASLTEKADPTRDPSPCFRKPTVDCLLGEAVETSKAIADGDQRDWALGELLAAQAKTGRAEDGRQTLRRMSDPRQVMASLRDIAEAAAAAGRGSEALEATEIIPDPLKKAEAYAAIIDIQAARQDRDGAGATATSMQRDLEKVDSLVKRVTFHARVAVALNKVGATEPAEASLENAILLSRRIGLEDQPLALRTVAVAMAEMGRPTEALAQIERVRKLDERIPVLVAAATAQAEAGDTGRALDIAADIGEGRYRAVVLSRVAAAQIKAGDAGLAKGTITLALAVLADIKLPFARDFALSRIAAALTDLARTQAGDRDERQASYARAVETASKIEDKKLRATTLWTVAAERRRAGDEAGAQATRELADKATAEIESRLSQVWMLAELVASHLQLNELDPAQEAFDRGVAITENVHNAWSRTRLLSKLAATLIGLDAAQAAAAASPK